jgi:2-methylcitrate dehydratase PrpD
MPNPLSNAPAGFTSRLARFLLSHRSYDAMPLEAVERSKEMMVNAAAVALAAAAQPQARALTQLVQDMRGNGKCTIIGMGLRSSPMYATLTNGMLVRLLDFDDQIIERGVHPSCAVFPVVMALGEMNGRSGKDVLAAYALGCEVIAKLAGLGVMNDTVGGLSRRPGDDRDGFFGVLGAAAAAGLLLGLGQEQLESALSIAGGAAAAVPGGPATPARALQCGRAAMNGIMAATLAREGLAAEKGDALEAPGGLLERCCLGLMPEPAKPVEEFFRRLANPYDVVHPGVTLKLYPCGAAGHTAIDAVLQIMQQYQISPDQVRSARVSVTPESLALLPYATPQNGWEARYCLSYIAAATLLHGPPLIDFFSDAAVQDPSVRQMMDRVTVEATESASLLTPTPSTVHINLTDGRQVQHRVEFARGQPELPLDPEELDAKFLYCSRYILPPDHIEEAIEGLRNLENIDNVTGMVSVLGG